MVVWILGYRGEEVYALTLNRVDLVLRLAGRALVQF